MLIDSASDSPHRVATGFQHDAFVYTDEDDLVRQAAPFLHAGLAAGETVVAALPEEHNSLLRKALGGAGDQVVFLDMAEVGRNPARIISLWRDLLDEASGAGLRGLGEPAYPGRTPDELDEARLHELLLDLAFENPSRSFTLRCPYAEDNEVDPAELHPPDGVDPSVARADFRTPLPAVPARAERRLFGAADLTGLRRWVNDLARGHGLPADRVDDLELALHEICTNSVRFGGGGGTLSVWTDGSELVCDVADRGRIDDLLVGRLLPPADDLGGRGVWLANQLCDLVRLRSGDEGTQVRLQVRPR